VKMARRCASVTCIAYIAQKVARMNDISHSDRRYTFEMRVIVDSTARPQYRDDITAQSILPDLYNDSVRSRIYRRSFTSKDVNSLMRSTATPDSSPCILQITRFNTSDRYR
jgi:hypothetical protein